MSKRITRGSARNLAAQPTLADTLITTVEAPDPKPQSSAAAAEIEELPAMSTRDALAQLRSQIEGRLDDATRWRFTKTANALIQLGNRKQKLLAPRRQRMRSIVEKNRNITRLYNEYATLHATTEKRVTYRLPIFLDLKTGAEDVESHGDEMEGHQDVNEAMGGVTAGHDTAATEHTEHMILADATNEMDTRADRTPTPEVDEPMADTQDFSKLLFEAVTGKTELYNAPRGQTGAVAVAIDEQAIGDIFEQLAAHATSPPQAGGGAMEPLGSPSTKGDELAGEHTQFDVCDGRITHDEELAEAEELTEDALGVHENMRTAAGSGGSEQIESDVGADLTGNSGETMIIEEEKEDPTAVVEPEASSIRAASVLVQDCLGDHEEASTIEADVTVKNPEAFPVHRIQDVQAGVYPGTRIAKIATHVDPDGTVRKVTLDVDGGHVNHLIIKDARIIAGLGLSEPPYNTITSTLRAGETFKAFIPSGQTDIDYWSCRVLKSARHAFLCWLDLRETADPRGGPFWQEARLIARELSRRAPDVFREINDHWNLEQSAGGSRHRANRIKLLGENPQYSGTPQAKICMWG